MKNLWRRVWYSEPIVFVGAVISAWLAIVAFDQGNDTWDIPLWMYVVAVPTAAFFTRITRRQVSPVDPPEPKDSP